MANWQRIFAYTTGTLVFGLLIIIVSHNFIQHVAREGTSGLLFLLGFGLVFLNINFVASRRFVIKAEHLDWVCYLMAVLTFAPTVFWVYTKDVGLGDTQFLFIIVTIFSSFLGTYFGIRRGRVKRAKYIERLREEERELPESLRRPHDDLRPN